MKELDTIATEHQRDLDRKDALLQMLLGDVRECEEEAVVLAQAHMAAIDKLVHEQDGRLLGLETNFHQQVEALKTEHAEEREELVKLHKQRVLEMRHVVHTVQAAEADKKLGMQAAHEQKREELNAAALERVHYLQSVLDSRIEDLEEQFEQAHVQYQQSTEQRMAEYRALMTRGEKLAASIEAKRRRLAGLKRDLQRWRVKLINAKRDESQRNKDLSGERDRMWGALGSLKGKLQRKRAAAQTRLKHLSGSAQAAKGVLAENIRLAERVLGLAEAARKLESEAERILPFAVTHSVATQEPGEPHGATVPPAAAQSPETLGEPQQPPQGQGGEQLEALQAELADTLRLKDEELLQAAPPTDGSVALLLDEGGQPVAPVQVLDKFFRRVNRAALDTLTAEAARAELQEENAHLQDLVKQCMEGLTLSQDTLAGANPLLVVNGKHGIVPGRVLPAPKRQVSLVEGAHAMASTAKMTRA